MRSYYIYVMFRPWNGLPFYIGKGKGPRWNGAAGRNPHFKNIVARAERLGLEIPKVKIRSHLTEDEAFRIEVAFIAAIGRGGYGPLVNLTNGGDGASGAKRSEATRKKMGIARIGKAPTFKGRKHSIETRIKISKARSNMPLEERIAIGNRYRGKKLSPEHRKALSKAKKGKPLSASHIKAIADGNRGGKRTEETRARMSIAQLGNFGQTRRFQRSCLVFLFPEEFGWMETLSGF